MPSPASHTSPLNDGYAYREQVQHTGTVLAHLTTHHPHSDAATWRARIAAGEVEVDGRRAEPDQVLCPGQTLVWHRPPWHEPPAAGHCVILHADEQVLAVIKPRGLPTLPGAGFLQHTLLGQVRAQYPEAVPMHRLGRATSGLVLCARTAAAASLLQGAWRAHAVRKVYRALAAGVAAVDRLELTTPIGPVPHPRLGTVHAACPDGKPARSVATVLERRAAETLFAVEIETGRPHQIRIHLAAAGHPLVGDPLYAAGGQPRAAEAGLPGDGGYFLHAEILSFRHPATGEQLTLHAPPPVELRTRAEGPAAS